jgi:hypothetical protein
MHLGMAGFENPLRMMAENNFILILSWVSL